MRRQGFVVLSTPAGKKFSIKSGYKFALNSNFSSFSQIISKLWNFLWCAFPFLYLISLPTWQSPIHFHRGIYLQRTCSSGTKTRILLTWIKQTSIFGRADQAALRTGFLRTWLTGLLSQKHRHRPSPSQRRSPHVKITNPSVAMIRCQPLIRLESIAGPVSLPWSINRNCLCTGLIHILRFPDDRTNNICKKNSNIACCAGMIVSRLPQSIKHFRRTTKTMSSINALTTWQTFLRFLFSNAVISMKNIRTTN